MLLRYVYAPLGLSNSFRYYIYRLLWDRFGAAYYFIKSLVVAPCYLLYPDKVLIFSFSVVKLDGKIRLGCNDFLRYYAFFLSIERSRKDLFITKRAIYIFGGFYGKEGDSAKD